MKRCILFVFPRLPAKRPGDHPRPNRYAGKRIRRAASSGGGEEGSAARVAQAVAVLLGYGRRGGLDKGEGTAHVLAGPRPRPHQRTSPPQQTKGAGPLQINQSHA